MKSPCISIIVPCYNQAQYLDECLQSVLEQTYPHWECIIVDDGSPDDTAEVAKKWTQKDSRFKYLRKENGGLSSARNAGISMAQGEWILPLDADDKIGNQYLELAAKEFDKGYTVIFCQAEFFGEKQGDWVLPAFSLQNLAQDNCIFCSAFYPKKLWAAHNGYDESMHTALEDWEFWIRIIREEGEVYRLPYTGFFYRIKSQSMINGLAFDKKIPVLKYIEKKHIDFFLEHLGTFHKLYWDNRGLINQNLVLKRSLGSKRYQIVDKLMSLIGK